MPVTKKNVMTTPGHFNEDIVALMRADNATTAQGVINREKDYIEFTKDTPDAPKIEDLTVDDYAAILGVRRLAPGQPWAEYHEKTVNKALKSEDEKNIWLPSWVAKSPDRPHKWYQEMCEKHASDDSFTGENESACTDTVKQDFNNLLRKYCPDGKDHDALIGTEPTEHKEYLTSIIKEVLNFAGFLLRPMARSPDCEFEFKYATVLCLMAGFGFTGLRMTATRFKEEDPQWNMVLNGTDDEIRVMVKRAKLLCGYPICLARVDASDLFYFLLRHRLTPGPWFKFCVFIHICKYVRCMLKKFEGDHAISVVYKTRSVIPMDTVAYEMSMTNSNLMRMITPSVVASLRLDITKSDKEFDAPQRAARSVFEVMTPKNLMLAKSVTDRFDIMIAPTISFRQRLNLDGEWSWCDHNQEAGPVAILNKKTGHIEKYVWLTHEDVAMRDFPVEKADNERNRAWMDSLPNVVEPHLPFYFIQKYIRNINYLGTDGHGLAAAVNTVMMLAMKRKDLDGSQIGDSMRKEFPIFTSLPMRGEEDVTTNQGKTTILTILARVLVPTISPIHQPTSNSAPAERSATFDIRMHGTVILDEFKLRSGDGIFNASNLQGLATGTLINPGLAGSNDGGIQLKYPLFMTMKYSNVPPDIRNRQIPIFLDILTEENQVPDADLQYIMSDKMSILMRLSAEMWSEKNDFIERVRRLTVTNGKWRYKGHQTVAKAIFDDFMMMEAYLKKAEEQCDVQLSQAQESGTVAATGGAAKFDVSWYFNNCSPKCIEDIYRNQKDRRYLASDMLKEIVEDGGQRVYERELMKGGCSEQSAMSRFGKAIRSIKAGVYRLRSYEAKDVHFRLRRYVTLFKVNEREEEIEEPPKIENKEKPEK